MGIPTNSEDTGEIHDDDGIIEGHAEEGVGNEERFKAIFDPY